MSYRDEVHQRLKTAILNSGMTYREIMQKAGLHINSVSKYMGKDKVMPSAESLGKICRVLGASADEILGLKNNENRPA